jgi:hypothetical protein
MRLKTGVNIYERLGTDIGCVNMHSVQMWLCLMSTWTRDLKY